MATRVAGAFLRALDVQEDSLDLVRELSEFLETLLKRQDRLLDLYLCFFLKKILDNGLEQNPGDIVESFYFDFLGSFVTPEEMVHEHFAGDFLNFITLITGTNILCLPYSSKSRDRKSLSLSLNEESMKNDPWLIVQGVMGRRLEFKIVGSFPSLNESQREEYLRDADVLVIERDLPIYLRTIKNFLLEKTGKTSLNGLLTFNGSSYKEILEYAQESADDIAIYENLREKYANSGMKKPEKEAFQEFRRIVERRLAAVFTRVQYLIDHVDD